MYKGFHTNIKISFQANLHHTVSPPFRLYRQPLSVQWQHSPAARWTPHPDPGQPDDRQPFRPQHPRSLRHAVLPVWNMDFCRCCWWCLPAGSLFPIDLEFLNGVIVLMKILISFSPYIYMCNLAYYPCQTQPILSDTYYVYQSPIFVQQLLGQ